MTPVFSYGSLQERSVQLAKFGRELTGHADALPGYARRSRGKYFNVEPGAPDDAVDGVVFELTDQEMEKADRYEDGEGYYRIEVKLRSGAKAWVYLAVNSPQK